MVNESWRYIFGRANPPADIQREIREKESFGKEGILAWEKSFEIFRIFQLYEGEAIRTMQNNEIQDSLIAKSLDLDRVSELFSKHSLDAAVTDICQGMEPDQITVTLAIDTVDQRNAVSDLIWLLNTFQTRIPTPDKSDRNRLDPDIFRSYLDVNPITPTISPLRFSTISAAISNELLKAKVITKEELMKKEDEICKKYMTQAAHNEYLRLRAKLNK
jgi:hypothetical protein